MNSKQAAKAVEVGDTVFVDEMPADSHYSKVRGIVTRINNGFATIGTDVVKSRFGDEWRTHECVVGARVANCVVQA